VPEVALVGRAHELTEARQWLARATGSDDVDGVDRLLVISGPGGIGKTRLVTELLRATPDVAIGRGGAHLGAAQVPLLPWADALRMLSRTLGPQVIEAAAGEVAVELAPLLPQLRRPEQTSAGATADLLPWFLGRLTERDPVVIVLEDLHLTDLTTLATLPRVVEQVQGRFALVVTARPEGDPRDPEAAQRWADSLTRLRRVPGVRLLPLGPLSSAEAVSLATLIGGQAYDRHVAEDIATRAEGVPFFVEELAQAALSGVPDDRLHTDVLGARLQDLDPATTSVVRAVAIHGVSVRHDELAELSGLDDAALLPAIRRAVAVGVLVAGDDGDYRLRHTLIGEAVRAQMLPVERRELHAACARTLSARLDTGTSPGEVVPARTFAALARHWEEAAAADRALTATLRAADAVAAVAPLEASRHFEHAAELFVRVDGAGELTGVTLAQILESAATYAASAGEAAACVELAGRALAVTDPDDAGRRSRLHRLRAVHGEGVLDEDEVVAEFDRAIAESSARGWESAELADALAASARHWMLLDRNAAALPLAQRSLETARRVGAAAEAALAEAVLGASLCYLGRYSEGLPTLREAVVALRAAGRRYDAARTSLTHVWALFHAGDVPAALAAVETELGVLASSGGPSSIAQSLVAARQEMLIWLGRWDEVDDVAADEINSAAQATERSNRGELRLRRGDLTGAHADFTAVHSFWTELGLAEYDTGSLTRLVEIAVLRSDDDEAGRLVAQGLATVEDTDTWVVVAAYVRAGIAGQAAAARAGRSVDDGLGQRLSGLMTKAAAGAPAGSLAAAELATAHAEWARLAGGDEPAAWAAAEQAWAALGFPWWVCAAQLRRIESELARGRSRTAVTPELGRLRTAANELGARAMVTAVEDLARRAGIDLAATVAAPAVAVPAPRPSGPLGLLSRRELEVLDLVAEGLSNRRIAERLFITEKTASAHVSHILAKLGVANRLEAATLVLRSQSVS
jgi:DNA-binding CsgD family transcriptional regulator